MPNSEPLMTAAEVAAYLKVHVETVRRWAREGTLPAVRPTRSAIRFRRVDVERLLAEAS